ncbi:vestitone reductase-like [Andrographis paniculata]|uniref:vestitone reductase-like n=1 Tax=Andrographis paniculata TaxID=175694 RepID=UPI0021E8FE56|nr:vestitone reductase-like [Andrographis paniculata]
MADDQKMEKGRVCVTGGTGFVASWLIMKLLQHGYSVNATVRSHPSGSKKDPSFLTSLPGAQDRLQIFPADLNDPGSFGPAIEGCVGLFHVAHPMDAGDEETATNKSVGALLGILQACVDSKTIKKVVYTSSAVTVAMKDRGGDEAQLDEGSWSEVNFMRNMTAFGVSYCISKTMTEKAALEFATNHGLDLATVIPPWIHGPFICPNMPFSVKKMLGLIIGNEPSVNYARTSAIVHVDDIAEAHIYLFEHREANGRYICSAVEATDRELVELVSSRYPEFKLVNPKILSDPADNSRFSSKKLLETGFTFKHGLEEMFDDAIRCCKNKGLL